jgi:flagellar biosynthesis protein FlhF
MRLKTFTAANMADAMRKVRDEMGDDAIIVSTQKDAAGEGVRVTAALEATAAPPAQEAEKPKPAQPAPIDSIRRTLDSHNAPPRLVDRLLNAARQIEVEDPVMALAGALEAGFTFAPIPQDFAPKPFILVGPHGSGKTVTVAKLAARAMLSGHHVRVVTTDTTSAGAIARLDAFTKIMSIRLETAESAAALAKLLQGRSANELTFIDSTAGNPFNRMDMADLSDYFSASDLEPVLVLAAGGDPVESAEIGEIYAGLGATRMLATRLDMTRRLGSLLSAADAGRMMFCDVCATPQVANGVSPINPVVLAQLLMPDYQQTRSSYSQGEART